MAILGIISILLIFFSFSILFANLEQFTNKDKPLFDKDYYELGDFDGEVEVTKKQEEIFNYISISKHSTYDHINLACDASEEEIEEMVFLGILKKHSASKIPAKTKNVVYGVLSVVVLAALFYFANYYILVRVNIRYTGIIFYGTVFALLAISSFFKFTNMGAKKTYGLSAIVLGSVAVIIVFYAFFGGRTYFHATAYSELINVIEDDFTVDVQTVDAETLPIVDKQYGEKLGSLKLGEYPGIGSEFETGEYSDIIYQGEQYLVSPLEFRGIFKWFNNNQEGTPGYIMINKVTAETTLVNLRDTDGEGMIYTPSAFFNEDLVRYAYMNGMSKYKFEQQFFEIDDEGHPYYILQYSLPTIFINGGTDIAQIAVVDAITGDINSYDPDDVPEWVESIYPSNLLLTQLNFWGSLQEGWLNSIFGQRGVLQPSNGKRTIMNEGELYYFTGLTSAGSDESTIGFVYMNTRTKETKLYKFPGATEQAAMNKVLTLLPQNNIYTSFPIPINVADTPTYFIAIKGEDGRILRHVFMSVQQLEVYGIEETKAKAYTEYLLRLGTSNVDALQNVSGTITKITSYVVDGNTVYWVELDNDKLYLINVSTFNNDTMMFFISLGLGDTIDFEVQGNSVLVINTD